MTNAANIIIHNAHLRFADKILFENLNVTIAAGRWTCLLGPSGVGKSSLLRLIAGLAEPHTIAGEIRSDQYPNLENKIAYMAQSDLLLPWATVLENVLLGAKLRKETKPIEKAKALLKQVGLDTVITHYPHELSGGMRQRVALVRTLLENRPIVLMDEPFSALDAINRHRLQNLAAELLVDKTVLLVTHDPVEALRLGHDIYVMADCPVKLGTPICLTTPTPRAMNDPEVSHLEDELLERLQAAQEDII